MSLMMGGLLSKTLKEKSRNPTTPLLHPTNPQQATQAQ